MKKVFLLLMLMPTFLFAQKDSLNMAVKANFLSPIDVFNFPTIDLSLEQRIANNFSVGVEGGYEFYHFQNPDTAFIKPGGYKLSAEFRLYHPFLSLTRKKELHTSLTGFYIGADYFYRKEQYNSAVEFTKAKGDTSVFIDNYWTSKKAGGVDLLFGYQWTPFSRVVADAYLGAGILRRTIDRHELTYSENSDEISESSQTASFFSAKDLKEKNGTGLSFSFGLRIGFVIY
jgi:hypothetical protein